LGLYTEELKYQYGSQRKPILILNIVIYGLLVFGAVLVLIALCIDSEWLLLPWMIMMTLDLIRGTISVIFIFIYCYGNLTRIAVGIFFLGIQIFHISLFMIIIAKWQHIRLKKQPVAVVPEHAILADGAHVYPTLPTAMSGVPQRDGYYQPANGYNTYAGREGTIYRSPPSVDGARYGTYGGRSVAHTVQ